MLPTMKPKKKGLFSKLFKRKPKEEAKKEEKPVPKSQERAPKAEPKKAEAKPGNPKAKPAEKGKKENIAPVKQTSIEKLEKERMKAKQKFKYFLPDVPGVDGLFTHGIPSGAAVLIEGGPGSGKTIFCLQACVGACKRGIKVLFMSFEEPEYRLREHLREFKFNPEEYERRGILKIKRFNALDIARSVEALLSEAKKELLIEIQPVLIPQDFKPDLIFVDSLTSISSAFSGEENRFRIYMEQLFRYLEANRITSFLIRETPAPTHIGLGYGGGQGGEAVSFLSDGIIVIYNVFPETGERKRAIEILKMRGEAINRKLVEMDISSGKGMTIYPDKIVKGKYRLT